MIDDKIGLHEEERHHPPLQSLADRLGKTPTELMEDFIATTEVARMVVDALEGTPRQHMDGSVTRNGGLIKTVERNSTALQEIKVELKDGVKHKLEITKLQYTLAAGVITALATIAVALITGG
jgi:AraC-like DNA-binding protein